MDKGISNFSEEIYYEGKHFRKNNEIHIKRMFSTAFEKPKSLTARSLKKRWIKYLQGFEFFFMINSIVLLNVFYSVNLEKWPFTNILIYKFHLFYQKQLLLCTNCYFAPFFEATWLISQPPSCLNLLRFPFSAYFF